MRKVSLLEWAGLEAGGTLHSDSKGADTMINNALLLFLHAAVSSLPFFFFGGLNITFLYLSKTWIIITYYANSLFLSTTILWNPCVLKPQLSWYGSFRGNNALCISGSLLLTPVSLDVSLPAGSIDLFHATASTNGFLRKYAFLYPSRNGGGEEWDVVTRASSRSKKHIFIFTQRYIFLHLSRGFCFFFCYSYLA